MTPAERARQIDREEFAAECAAIRQRASDYIDQRRHQTRCEIANWLGREPPTMGYRPRRATRSQQPHRKPHKRRGSGPQHTINGVGLTMVEWAESIGISYNSLCTRISRLGSLEAAVAMGGPQRGVITVNGKGMTLTSWADHLGIARSTLYYRVKAEGHAEAIIADLIAHPPGVVSDFGPFEETGAGSTAQETPNITFSRNDA